MVILVTFLFGSFEIGGLVGRIEFWNKIINIKNLWGMILVDIEILY